MSPESRNAITLARWKLEGGMPMFMLATRRAVMMGGPGVAVQPRGAARCAACHGDHTVSSQDECGDTSFCEECRVQARGPFEGIDLGGQG